jgi:ADP-heptose:LPS heptosyltransferase
MTIPALKIIREYSPNSHLTFVTTDYAGAIARICGLIDEVRELRFQGELLNFFEYRRIKKEIRKGKYGKIFLFGKVSRYQRHVGPIEGTFLSKKYSGHQAEKCARAVMEGLELGDVEIPGPEIELEFEKGPFKHLDPQAENYVVLHPGCNRVVRKRKKCHENRPEKVWPPEKYSRLADMLLDRYPDMKVVVVGTDEERKWLAGKLPQSRDRIVNLCGRTDILDLLRVLDGASALVCGDSGVMHLGTVVNVPIVVLVGPTDENSTGPFGQDQHTTVIRSCPLEEARNEPECMQKISVDEVFGAVQKYLNQ